MGLLKMIVKQDAGKEYLKNAVNYIVNNPDACFYSGINICPEKAYKQMRCIKKYFGKTSGNQLVHFVVCFNNEVVELATVKKYARKIAEYYKPKISDNICCSSGITLCQIRVRQITLSRTYCHEFRQLC